MLAPIVYFPIELKSREFDSKVALAATLAAMGYPSVIGQQWALAANFSRVPAGTIFFKSFNKIHQTAMLGAKKAGHRIVSLEEELLGQTQEKGIAWSCNEGVFNIADLVLANGEFEAAVIRKAAGNGIRVEVSGNGRIDLLKPKHRQFFEKQINDVRGRYGDFVLVNTNFGIHNSIWKTVEEVTRIQISAGFMKPDDPDSVQIWEDYIVWEKSNMDAMHSAIRELSRRRPNQNIIIRPHPGEDLKRWDGLFPGYRNIFIVREGSHVPWTLACRVLMHTCCTTGFEAYVAGRPAFSLSPYPSWLNDSVLSSRVNPQFRQPDELIDAVEEVLDGGQTPVVASAAEAEPFVWNCTINDAFPRIASLLVENLPPPGEIRLPPLSGIGLEERIKSKFEVTLEECSDTLARAAEMLGLRDKLECAAVQEGIFLIAPASARQKISVSPPLLGAEEVLARMEEALRARNQAKAFELFKKNIDEARYSSPCWFLAGVALFEMGRPGDALTHFQQAEATIGPEKNFQLLFMLAVTHRQLGQLQSALSYAEQAHRMAPTDPRGLELYKALQQQIGKKK